MRLNRIATFLFFTVVAVVILLICTFKETRTEINRATGAMRTQSTRLGIFKKPWTETSNWLSKRAAALGVNTDADWQLLTVRTDGLMTTSRGCNRAPEAYHLSLWKESPLAPEDADRFVLAFTKASESEREELIRKLIDGEWDCP